MSLAAIAWSFFFFIALVANPSIAMVLAPVEAWLALKINESPAAIAEMVLEAAKVYADELPPLDMLPLESAYQRAIIPSSARAALFTSEGFMFSGKPALAAVPVLLASVVFRSLTSAIIFYLLVSKD
jgi:hypothetical protein